MSAPTHRMELFKGRAAGLRGFIGGLDWYSRIRRINNGEITHVSEGHRNYGDCWDAAERLANGNIEFVQPKERPKT